MANRADSLWAWVTELPDGSVSQVGAMLEGSHTPLISRSREVVELMRPLAGLHAVATGQRVWLREYRDVVEHEDV
jgi:hypothetical protein